MKKSPSGTAKKVESKHHKIFCTGGSVMFPIKEKRESESPQGKSQNKGERGGESRYAL